MESAHKKTFSEIESEDIISRLIELKSFINMRGQCLSRFNFMAVIELNSSSTRKNALSISQNRLLYYMEGICGVATNHLEKSAHVI